MLSKREGIIPALIIFLLAGIFILDYFFLMVGGIDQTFSAWIDDFIHKEPMAVYLFGILCGHLFWQMKRKPKDYKALRDLYKAAKEVPTIYSDGYHHRLYLAIDEVENHGNDNVDSPNDTK